MPHCFVLRGASLLHGAPRRARSASFSHFPAVEFAALLPPLPCWNFLEHCQLSSKSFARVSSDSHSGLLLSDLGWGLVLSPHPRRVSSFMPSFMTLKWGLPCSQAEMVLVSLSAYCSLFLQPGRERLQCPLLALDHAPVEPPKVQRNQPGPSGQGKAGLHTPFLNPHPASMLEVSCLLYPPGLPNFLSLSPL